MLTGAAVCALCIAFVFHALASAKLVDALTLNAGLTGRRLTISEQGARSYSRDLRKFQSSHLVSLLRDSAAVADLSLNEVAFNVEGLPTQPFIRYRAAFDVTATYPSIRKFISHLLAGADGVVLDTVSCRRKDISTAELSCAMSVFVAYGKAEHG